MNVREQVYQFLQQSALQTYAGELAELIEPSIRIKTYTDTSLSHSHFGGLPNVPADFEYPMYGATPLTYLGQIHLDELPEVNSLIDLPRIGILYFFYDFSDFPLDSSFSWRCVYLDVPAHTLKPLSGYDERLEQFPHRSLTFELQWMLSAPEHKVDRLNQISKEVGDINKISNDGSSVPIIEEMCRQFGIMRPGEDIGPPDWPSEHRLFGYPTFMQHLMEGECQLRFHNVDGWKIPEELKDGVRDWQLLLQLDSDDSINWDFGDCGKLYFWIRRQDLAQRDFSNVWLIFQSD